MNDTKWLKKIDSRTINKKSKNFVGYEDIKQEISNLIKLIYRNEEEVLGACEFFDISGKILLYGEPGSGKTSLAYAIANEMLDSEDEIESYYLPIEKIIVSDLGATTKNIKEAFAEIRQVSEEKYVIIILDEVDRFTINRSDATEISELKRMFDEVLDFFDAIDIEAKAVIIGITNIKDRLEDAFIRRFSLVKEIRADKKLLKSFIRNCNEILNIEMSDEQIENFLNKYSFSTCDQIKRKYREVLLSRDYNQWKSLVNTDLWEG